jgi:hypothetical protein
MAMSKGTGDAMSERMGLRRSEPKPEPPRSMDDIASAIYPHLIPNREKDQRK